MCFKFILKKWNTLPRIFNFHFTYFHIVHYFILSDFIVFVPEMITGMLIFCVESVFAYILSAELEQHYS